MLLSDYTGSARKSRKSKIDERQALRHGSHGCTFLNFEFQFAPVLRDCGKQFTRKNSPVCFPVHLFDFHLCAISIMNVFLVEQTSRKSTPSVTKQEVLF